MERLRRLKQRLTFARQPDQVEDSALSGAQIPPDEPTQAIGPPVPGLSVEEFPKLAPVHHVILDHLFSLRPQVVVSLSRWHYDHYIPLLYRHVTLNSSSFAGLFRTHARREPWDNRTIRAYRNHTKTLRIFDKWSAFNLCTITYGDQPVYVPHRDLFLNVTKIELCWDVVMLQVEERIYYLHSNIAGQLGQHLKEGMVEEMVIRMKGEQQRTGMNQAFIDFARICKPKVMTCLYGPTWGLDGDFKVYSTDPATSRIPVPPPHRQFAQTWRIVFAPRLGQGRDDRPIMQDIKSHLQVLCATNSSTGIATTRNGKLKIEYHIPRATTTRSRLIAELHEADKPEVVAWMERNTEFFEVDGRRLWLGWSDLWQNARGRTIIKVPI
ncbi:hypothetical protein IAU59_005463 [Kwoniella sp. CBS 9459]